MQPIKITKKFTLTQDLVNQLVNLRKQGKTKQQIASLLKINKGTMNAVTKVMIEKGAWGYSKMWMTRLKNNNIPAKKTTVTKTQVKKTSVVRTPKVENYITINFKGVNVQVEKTSNIIITQHAILVK